MSRKNRYEILYEDEAVLIVNKPAGLLSIPDRYDPDIPCLANSLKKKRPELRVVHRLDKDTSGVMIFALSEEAHQALNRQFEKREVEKVYHAFVDGQPQPPEGRITSALRMSPQGKVVVHKKGKEAETTYRTLESFQRFSLMEVQIHTGRTHQIRVHFQSIGHPLLIDPLYGKREAFYLSEIKGKRYHLSKKEEAERPLINRTTLHACKLSFQHPASGEPLEFEAPFPKDLKALLDQLRKWNKTEG
jgi:RluA family pseudouridine synthase